MNTPAAIGLLTFAATATVFIILARRRARKFIAPAGPKADMKDNLLHQCAWCKKIRAVDGSFFEPIYPVGDHPVTHTICPACSDEQNEIMKREMRQNGYR